MTEWITADYKIADGHNNAAGFTAITSVTDGTNNLDETLGIPFYNRGTRLFVLGTPKFSGSESTSWTFSRLTIGLHKHMIDTYEGQVTIRAALGSSTFANYNATLIVPSLSELSGFNIDANLNTAIFTNVRLDFIDLEAI